MAAAEALSVEGVWKGFSCDGRWTGVLEDVSFDVGRGEIEGDILQQIGRAHV